MVSGVANTGPNLFRASPPLPACLFAIGFLMISRLFSGNCSFVSRYPAALFPLLSLLVLPYIPLPTSECLLLLKVLLLTCQCGPRHVCLTNSSARYSVRPLASDSHVPGKFHSVRSHPYTPGRSPYGINENSITVIRRSMAVSAAFFRRVPTLLDGGRMVVQRLTLPDLPPDCSYC